MTLVDTETGETFEPLTQHEAERLSQRIGLRLDTIADNYVAVMPLIREAITRQAHLALGYRSPGDYVRDRFGGALSRLSMEVRREVVRELTEAGLSTRAIGPVVGADYSTVSRDRARVAGATPDQTPGPCFTGAQPVCSGRCDSRQSTDPDDPDFPDHSCPRHGVDAERTNPTVTTGVDGKAYTPPTPQKQLAARQRRRPIIDALRDAQVNVERAVERLERLVNDDRFADQPLLVLKQVDGCLDRVVTPALDMQCTVGPLITAARSRAAGTDPPDVASPTAGDLTRSEPRGTGRRPGG